MIITLSILGLAFFILFIGKINSFSRFTKEIKELFLQSKSISDQTFHMSSIANLPEPVQRYFRHTLKEGQSYISYARIKHAGQFKTGLHKDWMDIKGEQYATTGKPGFIWKGTIMGCHYFSLLLLTV